MEEVMTQLLAEKMGVNPEELEAMRSGDPAALLAGQFSDPLVGALVSTMMRRRGGSAGEEEEDDEALLARARRRNRQLKKAVATAAASLNYIAEVFGACPVCWGQSDLCPRCAGAGKPGSSPPRQEELLGWVEPALKALGMRVVRGE